MSSNLSYFCLNDVCHVQSPTTDPLNMEEPRVVREARDDLEDASVRDRSGTPPNAREVLFCLEVKSHAKVIASLEPALDTILSSDERLKLQCHGRVTSRLDKSLKLPTTFLSPAFVDKLALVTAWEICSQRRPKLCPSFELYDYDGILGAFLTPERQLLEQQALISAVRFALVFLREAVAGEDSVYGPWTAITLSFAHGPLHADTGVPFGLMTPLEKHMITKNAGLMEDIERLTEGLIQHGSEDGSHFAIMQSYLRVRACLSLSVNDVREALCPVRPSSYYREAGSSITGNGSGNA